MVYDAFCRTCNKKFKTTKQTATQCYSCTLHSLIQSGGPEEGDFNTAQILSGEVKPDQKSFDVMAGLKDYI